VGYLPAAVRPRLSSCRPMGLNISMCHDEINLSIKLKA
jgi:hypothetical protein